MKIQFLKKPKPSWVFFVSVVMAFGSLQTLAEESPNQKPKTFFQLHVEPVSVRAFDRQSQILLASGLTSTLLAQTQDSSLRDQWKDYQKMSEQSAHYGDRFGEDLVGPIIALGQYVWDRDNGISHIRALSYSTIVTHVLKESVRRNRPGSNNHQSMPSGHTSSAFATATSLTSAYGWKMGAVAYPVATFVGLSRMADDRHWFSDVVAGAVIGIWMGRAASYSTESVSQSLKQTSSVLWIPQVSHEKVGLLFQYEF